MRHLHILLLLAPCSGRLRRRDSGTARVGTRGLSSEVRLLGVGMRGSTDFPSVRDAFLKSAVTT